jgi:hypothetical protein
LLQEQSKDRKPSSVSGQQPAIKSKEHQGESKHLHGKRQGQSLHLNG